MALRLGELGRVVGPGLGDLDEQLGGVGDLARIAKRAGLTVGPLEEAGERGAALFEEAQHVAAEFLWIGNTIGGEIDFGRHRLGGFGSFLLHRALGREGGAARRPQVSSTFNEPCRKEVRFDA